MSEDPLGEVLPQLGEVAGNHRGALPLHVRPVPEELVAVNGDLVTVEGDLDGLVAGGPRALASEEVTGLLLEAVGGERVDDVLHCGVLLVCPGLLSPLNVYNYSTFCLKKQVK